MSDTYTDKKGIQRYTKHNSLGKHPGTFVSHPDPAVMFNAKSGQAAALKRWKVSKGPIVTHISTAGGVYFIQPTGGGLVKIGCATNLQKRFRGLWSSVPVDLEILFFIPCSNPGKLESKLHKKYAEYRRRGEWFELSPEMIEDIKQGRIEV